MMKISYPSKLLKIFELAATNLKKARQRYGLKTPVEKHIKDGDLVLIKNNARKAFEPRYVGDYRVVSIKGQQVEVQPAIGGNTQWVHISHVKYVLPADNVISKLPDCSHFGRKTTLRINPDQIPDLGWAIATTLNTVPLSVTTMSQPSHNVPRTSPVVHELIVTKEPKSHN